MAGHRAGRKREQILKGAGDAFLELGFEGASTDEITRRAGVSKGTLYNYFPDKSALFAAFVEAECQRQASAVFTVEGQPEDIEGFLRQSARKLISLLLSPSMQGIFRLTVAEAPRFPELARIFYDSGPGLGTRRLAQVLAGAVARGQLAIDDVDLAAHQFDELCKGDLFYRNLFQVRLQFDRAEIDRIADAAVDMFMRAYAPEGPRTGQAPAAGA